MEREEPSLPAPRVQVCRRACGREERLGDSALRLQLIASGRVKLARPTANRKERIPAISAICGRDDFLGEAFLRDAGHYRSAAIAMSDVTTRPTSRDEYRRLAMDVSGFAPPVHRGAHEPLVPLSAKLRVRPPKSIFRTLASRIDHAWRSPVRVTVTRRRTPSFEGM